MDETSQIQPPPSFVELFAGRGGKLLIEKPELVARYELCEDLATHLTDQAQMLYHGGNSSEEGVLLGMHAALSGEGSAVQPGEARWVVLRLAELLNWRTPEIGTPDDDA
ncbi:hypothetical protein H9K76_17140 [Diaphorobacter ruginosibacter]|uniref:ATPase with chaperone activity n=1 Tax=Diaphorobacter ruginosibacter TaxID=1715720 RepID=A0A7G9RKZ0_9BURK|nr:hypothetical protein [Diaphorobacter ruginosibacter]QNN56265.1 hypothetical protein H9K76_17140 [Diaphorobacter ruginosibacter]